MRSDECLRMLAIKAVAGCIFTDRMVENPKINLGFVFTPLMFLDEEGRKELLEKRPVLIFEDWEKRGPWTVNGMPTFNSMQYFTEDEYRVFLSHVAKIKAYSKLIFNDS